MRIETKGLEWSKTEVIEYDSLEEFYKYICDTPFNEAFRWAVHKSVEGRESFTKTKSFEESVSLMKNGWEDMAQNLTKKLKVIENEVQPSTKRKTVYDVAGYQCSVPRYLQGLPNSMVRTTNIPAKQKIITVTKSIDYNGGTTTEEIVQESVKALQVVKKLEAQGYRINLNVAVGTNKSINSSSDGRFLLKIRIKNASERLNVSKLAFPLVHPSMLRRLIFRWIEVYPKITKEFVGNYGYPTRDEAMKQALNGEYLLPAFMKDVSSINSLDDLIKC